MRRTIFSLIRSRTEKPIRAVAEIQIESDKLTLNLAELLRKHPNANYIVLILRDGKPVGYGERR